MNQLPLSLQNASLVIDQSVIAAYAELTNDFNPIHLDPVFAAKTPMGSVIAHGTMSIGLIWQALEKSVGDKMMPHIDLDIRFIQPVRLGDKLIAGGQLQEPGGLIYDVWVRDQNNHEDKIVGTALIDDSV